MEANELIIKLEQRDWERLQKLSERNGEPMESLVPKMIARELARVFNKPPDIVISPEARRLYDAFVAGRTQTKVSQSKEAVAQDAEQTIEHT